MVHEHLYQMPDLSGLTLAAFLRSASEGAIASNSEQPNEIQLELDVEALTVPLDFAIPLGLLTNELVSNCLKHGIPRGQAGKISVFARSVPGALCFAVQDNGAGIPPGFEPAKSTSMGLKLAASLALQLGGHLEFTSENGCRVETHLSRYRPERGINAALTATQPYPSVRTPADHALPHLSH
jgi:two-component sensor histidine kinase